MINMTTKVHLQTLFMYLLSVYEYIGLGIVPLCGGSVNTWLDFKELFVLQILT